MIPHSEDRPKLYCRGLYLMKIYLMKKRLIYIFCSLQPTKLGGRLKVIFRYGVLFMLISGLCWLVTGVVISGRMKVLALLGFLA